MSTQPIRHIVAHVNDAKVSREVLLLGVTLARQHDASLTAVMGVEQVIPSAYVNATTAAMAQQLLEEHLSALRLQVEAMLAQLEAETGCAVRLQIAHGEAVPVLKAQAQVADLLLVGQRDPEGAGGMDRTGAANLMMDAGCPMVCVPHIGWPRPQGGGAAERVLVAWSPTSESARALRDALPLLARARHVELIMFVDGDTVSDQAAKAQLEPVREHLARHGVKAELVVRQSREPSLGERLRRGWIPDVSVAEALLSHAADMNADLIVMGGYGHSRAWQAVLGGVTRSMLETMTVPVLFSH
ncbi:MAG: universal stress protein [Proteobacteria bacterium]|nr:universal stress protein [Pseudomonadota bacterium]